MKKILGSLLLIFLLVSFTSCKKSEVTIVDNPSTEIATALNLEAVKNGKALNVNRGKAPYYDVKVSNDLTGSLFYQTINVNSLVNEKTKSVNLKPLVFSEAFANPANATLAEFIKIMNDKTNGITKESLGITLVDDDYSNYLTGNLTATNEVKVPGGVKVDNVDQLQLVVVYAPVYGIYYNSEDYHINVYLMVPVYYAFANTSTVANYTGSIKNCTEYCQVVEVSQNVFVLPSKN